MEGARWTWDARAEREDEGRTRSYTGFAGGAAGGALTRVLSTSAMSCTSLKDTPEDA